MSVCWFYVQGRCRFGDRCRYLHPREGYPHSDRCNLQQDNYRSSHQSRSPQQPLVRASSFDFNAALEQTRKQEERQKPRGYRDPSYGGSYGSAEDRHVDRDWYQGNQNRYQSNQDSYQDRYQGNQDRYHGSRDRYQGSQERYQGSQERYQGSQERYQGNRNRYQEDQDQHLGSQSKHRWVKDGHQSERSDNRSNGKAAVTFDFNEALDEATKLDEDRDASESLGDASLGVVRDMKTWRASGQWPFSSYGPYANSLSYPGFADASMEEVRWECYQAKEAGTMSAYIQQLNQIGQNVQQNIDHLLAMTPTAKRNFGESASRTRCQGTFCSCWLWMLGGYLHRAAQQQPRAVCRKCPLCLLLGPRQPASVQRPSTPWCKISQRKRGSSSLLKTSAPERCRRGHRPENTVHFHEASFLFARLHTGPLLSYLAACLPKRYDACGSTTRVTNFKRVYFRGQAGNCFATSCLHCCHFLIVQPLKEEWKLSSVVH
uniref:Nucleoporin NUP42 n=1 Tax=Ixodes ricinus TaxID=34613 RepID=V5HF44_IXORI